MWYGFLVGAPQERCSHDSIWRLFVGLPWLRDDESAAILNSVLISDSLSGTVAVILLGTLHLDIAPYLEITTAEEAKEETGFAFQVGAPQERCSPDSIWRIFVVQPWLRDNAKAFSSRGQHPRRARLAHGGVFRSPYLSTLLSVSVGMGMQVLGTSVIAMICALLGLLSPAHRGGLLQSTTLLLALMGVVAGYASSRLCKVLGAYVMELPARTAAAT